MKLYKVWLEIEEYDDETDESTKREDLSFALPFSASATCLCAADAVQKAQEMHASVNHNFVIDDELTMKIRRIDAEEDAK